MKTVGSLFAVVAFLLTATGRSFAQTPDAKAKDRNGETALMRAASSGNSDSVKSLIMAGADLNAKDKNGETALMRAALNGNTDSVKALIVAGAEVQVKDRNSQTALMKAAISGHADIVKLLLAAGNLTNGKEGGNASITAAGSSSAEDSAVSQIERDGALITPPVLRAGEGLLTTPSGGLIAFSLKAAQARLLAFGSGSAWRRSDPELFTLGGITRPEGVVVDRASGDVILIGHAEERDAPLTLDDFVVALRARMIEGKWPVVSIDPIPGKPMQEGDAQTVRFEGGIQNTQLGADLLDADHRLKRMDFGVLPTGVPGLKSSFDRWSERYRVSNTGQSQEIGVRFWFEPVQDRVIVRDDVVELGSMTVSVFTEVLSASIGGNKLDPKSYHDEDSDAFAREISSRIDDVARAHRSVARVRGLNGIVAVVAGLERIEDTPSLDYWLRQYSVRTVKTLPTVRVLRREEQFRNGPTVSRFFVEGGVELRAIALDLQSGDVSALRRAVLVARPEPMAVSWRLIIGQWVIPLSAGALPVSAIGPLYAQVEFLSSQRRWDDAIGVLNAVLCASDNLRGVQNSGTAGQDNRKSDVSLGDCLSVGRSSQEASTYLSALLNARGIAYHNKSQYERAVQDYDEAIRLNPNDAGVFNNRGLAYAEKGQHERAIQDYDQAIRLNPNLATAFYNRAISYGRSGQYDRALQDYDQAILIDPNDPNPLINRGHAYDEKGQHDRAIQDYDHAILLDPNTAEAFLNRGRAYGDKGQYDRAIPDFDQAIQLNPNLSMAYYNRGLAYAGKGQYDRAIQDDAEAIRLDPNSAEAFYNRGNAYAEKGQYDSAIEDFAQVIRLNPNDGNALNNRGNAYNKKGQYDRAIQDLNQAIRLDPNHVAALENRGNAYNGMHQYDRAIEDFDQALRLDPNDAAAFSDRGNAYDDKGQHDRAIQDYDQAIRLNPNYAETFYNRGNAFRALGQEARAAADFAKARQLNPNLPPPPSGNAIGESLDYQRCHAGNDFEATISACTALIQSGQETQQNLIAALGNRAAAYARKGQDDRAIEDYNHAMVLDPTEAKTFLGRGTAFALKGEYPRAIQDYTQAIRLNPNYAEAYMVRGFLLRELDDQKGAAADFAKARQLNPNLTEQSGITPSTRGIGKLQNRTAPDIQEAVEQRDLEKIKALLKDNPDLIFSKDNEGHTALHMAAAFGYRDVAELLLANKADVNAKANNNGTPLHEAADKGHKDVAELLLANKADVNAKANDGWTPLHLAADKGHKDVAELLLANKADVNAKENKGNTALHVAAAKGYKDLVELLLASAASINAKNSDDGWTPLHWAAAAGHKDVAEVLLANKADVNAKTDDGETPLHLAAVNGPKSGTASFRYKEVAELLLANQADVNAKANDGKTPARVAADKGHKDMAKLLRQHGGYE